MSLPFLLLGAQAAGLAINIFSNKRQNRANNRQLESYTRAQELEEAQIDLRMKQEQLSFEEQGLASVDNLREVMASTQALFASQGRTPGIGTTAAIERRSMTAYNKDVQAQELSKGFREHYYQSQKSVSRLTLSSKRMDVLGEKMKSKADLFGSAFNMINFSDMADGKGGFKSPLAGLFGG